MYMYNVHVCIVPVYIHFDFLNRIHYLDAPISVFSSHSIMIWSLSVPVNQFTFVFKCRTRTYCLNYINMT